MKVCCLHFSHLPRYYSLLFRHGPGLVLTEFIWRTGSTVLGMSEKAGLALSVGVHTVTLTVKDSGGNESTEATTIEVFSADFPAVKSLLPNSGPVAGGTIVTISGSGFTASAYDTKVKFGSSEITGSDIQIIDQKTIKVKAPAVPAGIPVDVFVETTVGKSNIQQFTYIAGSKIEFEEKFLITFEKPTVARFGPNGKLYVGNMNGQLGAITLDDDMRFPNGDLSRALHSIPWTHRKTQMCTFRTRGSTTVKKKVVQVAPSTEKCPKQGAQTLTTL